MSLWKNTCLLEARSLQLKKDTSCSGILIHPKHNFIITHSTLLTPFVTKKILKEINENGLIRGKSFKGIDVRVTVQKKNKVDQNVTLDGFTDKPLKMSSFPKSHLNVILNSNLGRTENELEHFYASVFVMWKAEKFAKTLHRLMPKSDGWKLTDDGKM